MGFVGGKSLLVIVLFENIEIVKRIMSVIFSSLKMDFMSKRRIYMFKSLPKEKFNVNKIFRRKLVAKDGYL
jgi:hypothetical protein